MRPKTPYTLRPLDRLNAPQAQQLLGMLAMEEAGFAPPAEGNLHCCSREHEHINGSPSLSVLGSDDAKQAVVSIRCFGRCKVKVRSLSEYLPLVGPEGAAGKFWTKDRVDRVVKSFADGEPVSLGWLEWKQAQGLPTVGINADGKVPLGGRRGKTVQSTSKLRSIYQECFVDVDAVQRAAEPSMIQLVCDKRGWDPALVREIMDDKLLALRRTEDDPKNVKLVYAYRGLYPSPPGLPVRIIKEKMLFVGEEDRKIRAYHYDANYPSDPIADFSLSSVAYQSAPRVVFLEGEPDGISWLHFRKTDAVICMGNDGQYGNIPKLLPKLNLADKEVIMCLDRDVKDGAFKRDVEKDFMPVISAIVKEKPKSFQIWMCPEMPGRESKDVNDFLKAMGRGANPEEFCQQLWPKPAAVKETGAAWLGMLVTSALQAHQEPPPLAESSPSLGR